jgi:hypothetical protein
LIRRAEGRVGFFVMCGRSNCSPINLPSALKTKPRVRRTMCEMWPTKEDFRIPAKNFDLTNGLNILRIISGLFFFPHVMGEICSRHGVGGDRGLFCQGWFPPARGMGLRRCRFGNRGGGCAGARDLHAVCGARRRRAARSRWSKVLDGLEYRRLRIPGVLGDRFVFRRHRGLEVACNKKQGATGITTVAPYVAGQWGRGDDRLQERLAGPGVVPVPRIFF